MSKKDFKMCRIIEQKLYEEHQKGQFSFDETAGSIYPSDLILNYNSKDAGDMSLHKLILLLRLLNLDIVEFFKDVKDRYDKQEMSEIETNLEAFPEFLQLLRGIKDFDREKLLDIVDYVEHIKEKTK